MTGREQGAGLGYVPAVDGLRAVAILAVILFHAQLLPAGFAGVDIFFVISGFVVTGSVAGRRFASLGAMLAWFYARRLVRILPALAAMLLVTVLATQLFIPQAWLSNAVPLVALTAFAGFSNVALAIGTDSYFGVQSAYNPFTHTWSLGVEEQFYLIFPLLLWWRARARPMPEGRMLLILGGLTLASLAACAAMREDYAFYLIPARFWELGTGMLLYLTIDRWRPWIAELKGLHRAELAIVSAALVAAGLAGPAGMGFPFPLAIPSVLGTAGLIALVCAVPEGIAARLLATRPMVATGKLSYSLYLWHWPVIVLFRWTAGLHTLALQLAALAIGIALALLSYFLVERPVRASRRIAAMPRGRAVLAGGVVILASAGIAQAMFAAQPLLSLSVTRDHAAWYADERHPLDPARSHCRVRHEAISVAGTQLQVWKPEGCTIRPAGFTLHAIGDSHAVAYAPAYRQLVAELGIEARVWARPRCPFLKLIERGNPNCLPVFGEMIAYVRAHSRPGDLVFLPALRMTRFINQFGPDHWPKGGRPDGSVAPETMADARTLLARLAATGLPILFEAPKPIFGSPTFRCADWFNRHQPVCAAGLTMSRARLLAIQRPVRAAMAELARTTPRTAIWDPFPILCPRDPCEALPGGRPLVMDGDHLSGHANDLLYPSLRAAILRAQKGPAPDRNGPQNAPGE